MWTIHERRSAISRMLRENKEYILVYFLDDTNIEELKGISPDVGFIRKDKYTPEEVVGILVKKLKVDAHLVQSLLLGICCSYIVKEIGRVYETSTDKENRKPVLFSSVQFHFCEKYKRLIEATKLSPRDVLIRCLNSLKQEGYVNSLDYMGMVELQLTKKGLDFYRSHGHEQVLDIPEL
jgi:hypothetical protein